MQEKIKKYFILLTFKISSYICDMENKVNKGTNVTFRPDNKMEQATRKWLLDKLQQGEGRTLAGTIMRVLIMAYKREMKIK